MSWDEHADVPQHAESGELQSIPAAIQSCTRLVTHAYGPNLSTTKMILTIIVNAHILLGANGVWCADGSAEREWLLSD